MVSHTGIEPVTPWLKVMCSTNWANGSYLAVKWMGWPTGLEPATTSTTNWRSTNWTTATICLFTIYHLKIGAGDEGRTRDIQLGRLTLYQLSYSRIINGRCSRIWTCDPLLPRQVRYRAALYTVISIRQKLYYHLFLSLSIVF